MLSRIIHVGNPSVFHLNQSLRCSFNLNVQLLSNRNGHLNQNHVLTTQLINQRRNFSLQSAPEALIGSIINSSVVDHCQKGLISVHEFTGLPWYAEIMMATMFVKLLLLPLNIYEKRMSYIMETKILPEFKQREENLRELTKRKLQLREMNSNKEATIYHRMQTKKIKQELYEKYNAHPAKRIICALSQFPFWLVMTFSVGVACEHVARTKYIENESIMQNIFITKPQAQLEGCLWFQDLTLPDPYLILPIIYSLSLFTFSEYNILIRRYNYIEDSLFLKIFTNVSRFIFLNLIYVSANAPSGLALYWLTNTTLGLAQAVLIHSPKFQKFMKTIGFPITKELKKSPGLKDFKNHLLNYYYNLKSKIIKR